MQFAHLLSTALLAAIPAFALPTTTSTSSNSSATPASWMPSGFSGNNSGIGSWFRADSSGDSTNGNSWCGYKYSDDSPGFAPDLSVMTNGSLATWGTDPTGWETAATDYCGLEATVYDPSSGNTRTMYIIDAFDPAWVKTPGSIDIMIDAWEDLSGRSDLYDASGTKTVEMKVSWTLTGRRSEQWSFKGKGSA